ncbi:MAG: hypothetical protein QNI99_07180 [Woeseiaceae bacterium]|nr:hypothetical protein [Woeseiaceae bacterium]
MQRIKSSLFFLIALGLGLSGCTVPVLVENDDSMPIPTASHLGIPSGDMIKLGGADCPGVQDEAILSEGGSNAEYVVPDGKNLVLTDIIVSPQNLNARGLYGFQILPNLPFTTSLIAVGSTDDWSSFQWHFTSGMLFTSGNNVRFLLNSGPACAEINAFGYLAEP